MHGRTINKILQLCVNRQIYVVSDGSSENTKGIYDWVLSTEADEILIDCIGQVTTFHPSSYLTKGFGTLSFVQFLLQVTLQYDITIPPIQYHTNNKGLVTCINNNIAADYNKLSNALQSEFDIISTITKIIKDMKVKNLHDSLKITQVKGNQDNKKDYEELFPPEKIIFTS